MTTEFKVFYDTAPLIYLIEKNELFYEKTKMMLAKQIGNNTSLLTSVLTLSEFGVQPYKNNKLNVIDDFNKLLAYANFSVEVINKSIAEITYKLRAKYQFLKTPDALQFAVAIHHKCNQFITNDTKLKKVTEIEVILIAEL